MKPKLVWNVFAKHIGYGLSKAAHRLISITIFAHTHDYVKTIKTLKGTLIIFLFIYAMKSFYLYGCTTLISFTITVSINQSAFPPALQLVYSSFKRINPVLPEWNTG